MATHVGERWGNYQLVRLLGQGGFAEVYLGEHVRLGMLSAIKILHSRLAGEAITSFQREARTIAELAHPHIIRVLDFDVQHGTPFLVLEYASHGSLRQKCSYGKQVPLAQVVDYVQQVASALQYAHDRRLIHRDVKPENMLLNAQEQVVLSDFGIATLAHSTSSMHTQDTTGTLAYMAPEQIQGKPRPASDQYALAVTVYQWLSGVLPFQGSSTELIAQHLAMAPPSLRQRVPNLPPEVEQAVFTALRKNPQERFGSVQAFATALEEANQARHATGKAAPSPLSTFSPSVPSFPPTPDKETDEHVSDVPQIGANGQQRSTQGTRPDVLPGERKPLSPTVPAKKTVTSWQKKAIIIATVVTLITAGGLSGLIGTLAWNNAEHAAALTAAYQSIVRHKPAVEYTMQDALSKQVWRGQGCTFNAQGYLVTDTMCTGGNGLPYAQTTELLVQVTMSIQRGTCGALAVSFPRFEADLCVDGTTLNCQFDVHDSGECSSMSSDAIRQGLARDNTLALEVVGGENNQIQLITFINGQYVVEQTAYQVQSPSSDQSESLRLLEEESANIFLERAFLSPTSSSVLYKDIKVWQVSNPVY